MTLHELWGCVARVDRHGLELVHQVTPYMRGLAIEHPSRKLPPTSIGRRLHQLQALELTCAIPNHTGTTDKLRTLVEVAAPNLTRLCLGRQSDAPWYLVQRGPDMPKLQRLTFNSKRSVQLAVKTAPATWKWIQPMGAQLTHLECHWTLLDASPAKAMPMRHHALQLMPVLASLTIGLGSRRLAPCLETIQDKGARSIRQLRVVEWERPSKECTWALTNALQKFRTTHALDHCELSERLRDEPLLEWDLRGSMETHRLRFVSCLVANSCACGACVGRGLRRRDWLRDWTRWLPPVTDLHWAISMERVRMDENTLIQWLLAQNPTRLSLPVQVMDALSKHPIVQEWMRTQTFHMLRLEVWDDRSFGDDRSLRFLERLQCHLPHLRELVVRIPINQEWPWKEEPPAVLPPALVTIQWIHVHPLPCMRVDCPCVYFQMYTHHFDERIQEQGFERDVASWLA